MIWIVLLLTAALLVLCREAYARLWSQGVEAVVAVEEPYVYAGEKAHFTEIIANRGRLPLPEIEVRFRMPQGPAFENAENIIISDHVYKRDVFALRPWEQITRRYILTCPKRGRYPVSDMTVKARSFFHKKEYELCQNSDACLTVYAAWTDVSGILAHCDTILGTLESRRKTIEDPFAWASIRAYTPQDPLRSVNWKASARTGELMVNTYASVQAMQYCIFLDATDRRIVKEEDLVELGISAAASLCRQLIKRGQEAGLYVYTDLAVAEPAQTSAQAQGQASARGQAAQPAFASGQAPARGQAAQPAFASGQAPARGQAVQPAFAGGQAPARGQAAQPAFASGQAPAQMKMELPPARGQAQLTKIEQVLTADHTGFLKQKAGQTVDMSGDKGVEKLSYAEWAMEILRAEASDCINVFISKEEESLRAMEKFLRAEGKRAFAGQNAPVVLVQPVAEDGGWKLRSRILHYE